MVDIGVESTVVRVVDNQVHILRPGKITPEDIMEIAGTCKLSDNLFKKAEGVVESPGMKYKHYAPNNKCILVYSNDENKIKEIIEEIKEEKTLIIGSDHLKVNSVFNQTYKNFEICIADDCSTLEEISHNIFTLLRKADTYEPNLIIIEGVKKEGLGIAIMNRLIRAASYNYIEK